MELLGSITNAQLKDWLIFIAGSVGLLWYYLCIVDMGSHPTPKDQQAPGFRQFQSLSVTTISVSLATYVGYVVGLPSLSSNTAKTAAANATAAAASAGTFMPAASSPLAPMISVAGTVNNLQLASAAMYVISLLLAVYFYWKTKDNTEPAVTGLARSLLGFVAGVFSISLNAPI
jgi:hypothetical protein